MGWESAIKKPPSGVPGAGAYTPKSPVYRTAPPEPVWAQDDLALCQRYYDALYQLKDEDRRYRMNYIVYDRWPIAQRLRWIYAIEQQAADELDTIGVVVVTRVVMNRLGD